MGRLGSKEVEKIASELNNLVNIPLIGEEKEQIILEKIIGLIDNALYEVLPDEIYDLVHMASDGISAKEAKIIRQRLPSIINPHVNIPIVTEEHEKVIIDKFLDIIELAIQKGKNILSLQ